MIDNVQSWVKQTLPHALPDIIAAPPKISARRLAGMIDHTALKPQTTAAEIRDLCAEARKYQFASVCVNPVFVPLAVEELADSDVPVCTVIGFPLGAARTAVKVAETEDAIAAGAEEVDMVIHIGGLKAGDYEAVRDDIAAVVEAAHAHDVLVKVIIETALLTEDEIVAAAFLVKDAGADYIKTSTGFSSGGATAEHVSLMAKASGEGVLVKASGGVRTYADACRMVAAGAARIGASSGVAIMEEADHA